MKNQNKDARRILKQALQGKATITEVREGLTLIASLNGEWVPVMTRTSKPGVYECEGKEYHSKEELLKAISGRNPFYLNIRETRLPVFRSEEEADQYLDEPYEGDQPNEE